MTGGSLGGAFGDSVGGGFGDSVGGGFGVSVGGGFGVSVGGGFGVSVGGGFGESLGGGFGESVGGTTGECGTVTGTVVDIKEPSSSRYLFQYCLSSWKLVSFDATSSWEMAKMPLFAMCKHHIYDTSEFSFIEIWNK
jgi:hypothetical protein